MKSVQESQDSKRMVYLERKLQRSAVGVKEQHIWAFSNGIDWEDSQEGPSREEVEYGTLCSASICASGLSLGVSAYRKGGTICGFRRSGTALLFSVPPPHGPRLMRLRTQSNVVSTSCMGRIPTDGVKVSAPASVDGTTSFNLALGSFS